MRSLLMASLISILMNGCGEDRNQHSASVESINQLSTVVFKAHVVINYVRPIPFPQIQRFARSNANTWQDVPESDKELRAFVKELETLPFVDTNAHDIRMTLIETEIIDSPRIKISNYFQSHHSDNALTDLRSFLSVNGVVVSKNTIALALLNALHCSNSQCSAQVIELFEGIRGLVSVDADLIKFSRIDFNAIMKRIAAEVKAEPDHIHP